MSAEERLASLGIELPDAPVPAASYVPCVRTGNLLFLSGQGTMYQGERRYLGKLGKEISEEEGYQAARICGLNLLAQLRNYLGTLDRVKRIVHLKGFVASDPEFTKQPAVVNGASDLMEQVFGEAGRHSRSALGMAVLPGNISVEIELIAEIKGDGQTDE
ncbi:MAG: RidA family protein [Clostridiaceae bacterium]|nr:RidA family protein [Clostridiaceae bacterium]